MQEIQEVQWFQYFHVDKRLSWFFNGASRHPSKHLKTIIYADICYQESFQHSGESYDTLSVSQMLHGLRYCIERVLDNQLMLFNPLNATGANMHQNHMLSGNYGSERVNLLYQQRREEREDKDREERLGRHLHLVTLISLK